MLNGVIIGKLRNLDEVIGELRSLGPLTTERLATEWVVRRAVERCLQVGVEIVLDVCHRILALSGKTPAATSREAIEDCVALGVLSRLEPYGEMVGFRNMVVHRYDRIDPNVLVDITNNHLQDFDRFRDEVLAYCAQ